MDLRQFGTEEIPAQKGSQPGHFGKFWHSNTVPQSTRAQHPEARREAAELQASSSRMDLVLAWERVKNRSYPLRKKRDTEARDSVICI
ncbi:hypothetical protein GCM10027405_25930 [Arthrobacter alkaliphilus]